MLCDIRCLAEAEATCCHRCDVEDGGPGSVLLRAAESSIHHSGQAGDRTDLCSSAHIILSRCHEMTCGLIIAQNSFQCPPHFLFCRLTFSNKIVSQLYLFIFRTEAGIRFIGINLTGIEQKKKKHIFFFHSAGSRLRSPHLRCHQVHEHHGQREGVGSMHVYRFPPALQLHSGNQ